MAGSAVACCPELELSGVQQTGVRRAAKLLPHGTGDLLTRDVLTLGLTLAPATVLGERVGK